MPIILCHCSGRRCRYHLRPRRGLWQILNLTTSPDNVVYAVLCHQNVVLTIMTIYFSFQLHRSLPLRIMYLPMRTTRVMNKSLVTTTAATTKIALVISLTKILNMTVKKNSEQLRLTYPQPLHQCNKLNHETNSCILQSNLIIVRQLIIISRRSRSGSKSNTCSQWTPFLPLEHCINFGLYNQEVQGKCLQLLPTSIHMSMKITMLKKRTII
mmetsp:Transcript_3746/g.6184  ORF Transcript_3746/g.6184 Transcript_3746/m.6184 type:complete len:212 (-) Transcript_3746:1774-2409(-)